MKIFITTSLFFFLSMTAFAEIHFLKISFKGGRKLASNQVSAVCKHHKRMNKAWLENNCVDLQQQGQFCMNAVENYFLYTFASEKECKKLIR